ncbi:MAG TPA: DUF1150 family protein [Acidisphaera sp.]|nr:DUF1150 family protein [Acidisphaera sp.]
MNINSDDPTNEAAQVGGTFDLRHLSVSELAQLGVSQIAYVRPVVVNGAPAFAIHAADGTPMAMAGDRDVAMAAIAQHEMVPVSVH